MDQESNDSVPKKILENGEQVQQQKDKKKNSKISGQKESDRNDQQQKQQQPSSSTGGSVESILPEFQKMNLKRTFEQLKLKTAALDLNLNRQPKSKIDALEKKFDFWDTQPVPKISEDDPSQEQNGPIQPPLQPNQIPKESLNLPAGFKWATLNIDDKDELQELYTLLFENYVEDDDNMFRFNYSPEFLRWVLKAPDWNPEWLVGMRVDKQDKKGKLVGFISAIPTKIRVYDKEIEMGEVNFLCVHKKLRSKRMAPVLISEITRRIRLKGIFQAVYTAGVFIPKPIATCRYFHRSLNPKKLIEVGFSHLTQNMTIQRSIRLYRLPEKPLLPGIRQMESKDVEQVHRLFTEHMKRFDLVPLFTLDEVAHWFLPKDKVVDSYVVENQNKKGELIGFFSFYFLPSTVMNHKQYKDIFAAYSFYNVPTDNCQLKDLMYDALIIAKNSGMDVFNALNQRENEQFLTDLKFGRGDGDLHYYIFNWKCAPLKPEKVGLVLQ